MAIPPGIRLWTKQLGVAGKNVDGRALATDALGNIFVAGNTPGGLDGNTLKGPNDFFVTKYDSTGTRKWTRQMGAAGIDIYTMSMAMDSAGHIFVAGNTYGGFDGNSQTGTQDLFVTELWQ